MSGKKSGTALSPAALIGPGLITGAADNDPSGIASYSQAGAAFGPNLIWSLLLAFPFMAGIQEISARIGRVTGRGLAANLVRRYPRPLAHALIALMVAANICNLGADLAAMGSALAMLIGGPERLYVVGFALLSTVLQIFLRWEDYAQVLKWLTLSLLAYVASAALAGVPWGSMALAVVWPHLEWSSNYATLVVAVLGTTISPYLFFWQAGLEVEKQRQDADMEPLREAPEQARPEIKRIRWDTVVGMGSSTAIAACIMLTTYGSLNLHGITDIRSASQAAEALRPAAGDFAFLLFSLGMIGTGLLAVPSLSASAAYGIAEAAGWRSGLDRKAGQAKGFYAILSAVMAAGAALNFVGIDPMDALIWSAAANGVAAAPIMAVLVLMAGDNRIMGKFVVPRGLTRNGWVGTALMAAAALVMLATL